MERMWIRESLFDIEKQVWRCWAGGGGGGGGWNFVCMFGGLWKIGEVKGEGVKSGNRTKSLITCAGLAALQRSQHLSWTQQKSPLRLYDNWASRACWNPSIVMLGSRVHLSNHTCWAARRMNQARNSTAGNTLFMSIASNLYIKMAALGWPFSGNTRIKVTSAELARPTKQASLALVIKPLLWVVLSRSFHVKALEFAAFLREYELI